MEEYMFSLAKRIEDTEWSRAFELYLNVAEKGNLEAQKKVAATYRDGKKNIKKNLKRAFFWYSRASLKGDSDSMLELAHAYEFGRGVEENQKLAIKMYDRSSKLGNVQANFEMGLLYEEGFGSLEVDKNATLRHWSIAADGGHRDAAFNLATCYYNGDYLPKDVEEARKYFLIGATQGDLECMHYVGMIDWREGSGDIQWLAASARLDYFRSLVHILEADGKNFFKWFSKLISLKLDVSYASLLIDNVQNDEVGDCLCYLAAMILKQFGLKDRKTIRRMRGLANFKDTSRMMRAKLRYQCALKTTP